MKGTSLAVMLVLWLLPAWSGAQEEPDTAAPATEPAPIWEPERPWEVIDVAIALDTSGSMQGLIDTARLRLWEIVNDLHGAEPAPTLRVALLTFGNGKSDPKAGWVKVESDLTEDLDRVSERLFELTSEGGNEYVGRVLQAALEGLSWTDSQDALRLVFVAGNEPADQDPEVDFRGMSDLARSEGIFVQSVFCGNAETPDAETWKELAELAAGGFAAIDHRSRVEAQKSPFDEELAALSSSLNETYIPLGDEGKKRLENRVSQDQNALEASPATAAGRALTKSTRTEASWDLVAAVEENDALLYELDDSELPEALQEMSFGEREQVVEEMRLARAEMRQRIAELGAQRREFLAEEAAKRGAPRTAGLDTVMRQTIRAKAEEKGFRFPER
jgi:hypothetical protein